MSEASCDGACQRCYTVAAEQPYGEEWSMADGVWIKEMHIPRAGTLVPQHAHRWDHTTFIAKGGVRIVQDGEADREVWAPRPIFIRAGVKHLFESLEDDTLALCIHNTARTLGRVEVVAEHQIVGA